MPPFRSAAALLKALSKSQPLQEAGQLALVALLLIPTLLCQKNQKGFLLQTKKLSRALTVAHNPPPPPHIAPFLTFSFCGSSASENVQ